MLRLRAPDPGMWEEFQQGVVSADAVARDPLLARWQRAAQRGAIADGNAPPTGVSGSDVVTRRDRLGALVAESTPVLTRISAELATRGVIALLADREGVIVHAWAGSGFDTEAARTRLVEGSSWSEGARGTNAIGTALAEATPVAVIGCAHFERINHGLFCYAAPIRDAFGELEAVLDVTGAAAADDPGLGVAVQAAASAIEHALRLRAYAELTPGGLATLRRLVNRSTAPAILLEAPGVVRLVNDAGAAVIGCDPATAEGAAVDAVLGASWPSLAACARDGRTLRFARGAATCEVELEPLVGADQRLLALMVYLAPHRPARATVKVAPPRVAIAPARHRAFAAILGDDPALAAAIHTAERLAATELPVLLLAETGTGKDLVARAIHAASRHADRGFVAVNCGAIQPSLLESELFGYAPGAFTGAARGGADGLVAAADGGTLFLDEIAELGDAAQASLLRVLEDGSYHRVGDSRIRRARFRLLAATCDDLARRVADGRFRRDLFFRIHGATVTLPPLRARRDRRSLASQLLAAMCAPAAPPLLADDALAHVERHDWPGNVRELKMALAHGLALAPAGEAIALAHLPAPLPGLSPARAPLVDSRAATRDDALRDALTAAMTAAGGNLSDAARRLGVARSTVYRMLGRLGSRGND